MKEERPRVIILWTIGNIKICLKAALENVDNLPYIETQEIDNDEIDYEGLREEMADNPDALELLHHLVRL